MQDLSVSQDFEKLGVFYLGRLYDLASKQPVEELLLYDSRDLVTHAVCVGMTGSGKTGLCITLIEEAAIDGIPAILIDPKGDLANLLLTFPDLKESDFLPWVDPDSARRQNLDLAAFAGQQAALWQKGLAAWGQDPARIQRLRDAADFAIYTPGSSAGLPISILKSFAAPAPDLLQDADMMRERISTTVTSLLGLVGIEADPIQSREHILLATILDAMWRQGQDLDLAALIQQVQSPPVTQIGVLNLESFYPAKDRFGLAMALNNLLASPGFSAWMEGEALDIDQILFTPAGKPRVAIMSIAHLSDSERMFFVSLLLNQVVGWMRGQSGTTSLRAMIYMDEIAGYLPPVSNPPSKQPLMTLMKQGRAFGVGTVLATQNPVDLDYKALSNAGTWFIGRLQAERDKARLLEGLEGAAASAGARFDRQRIEQIIAGLGSRVFLMNNTHEDAPVVFQTRWALSYLRGPLTRDQIKVLMDPRKASAPAPVPGTPSPSSASLRQPAAPAPGTPSPSSASLRQPAAPAPIPGTPSPSSAPLPAAEPAAAAEGQPPALPPDVTAYYVPIRSRAPRGSALVYRPEVLGKAQVHFVNAKAGIDAERDVQLVAPITDAPIPVDWESAEEIDIDVADLSKTPEDAAQYADLPAEAGKAKSYAAWGKDLSNWLYRSQRLELLSSPSLDELSQPDEPERNFRIRLQQAARERRDAAVEKLKQKYAPKIVSMQERIRRAQQAVEREAAQAKQAGFQAALSVGATLLGAVMGRKAVSHTTVSRATTAARGIGRTVQQRQDIGRADESVGALQKQLADLEAQFNAETAAMEAKIDPQTEALETVSIKPRRTDVVLQLVVLAWAPYWQDAQGKETPAWS